MPIEITVSPDGSNVNEVEDLLARFPVMATARVLIATSIEAPGTYVATIDNRAVPGGEPLIIRGVRAPLLDPLLRFYLDGPGADRHFSIALFDNGGPTQVPVGDPNPKRVTYNQASKVCAGFWDCTSMTDAHFSGMANLHFHYQVIADQAADDTWRAPRARFQFNHTAADTGSFGTTGFVTFDPGTQTATDLWIKVAKPGTKGDIAAPTRELKIIDGGGAEDVHVLFSASYTLDAIQVHEQPRRIALNISL